MCVYFVNPQAMVGTENSRKSLLLNRYLYGTLDVDIPKEKGM